MRKLLLVILCCCSGLVAVGANAVQAETYIDEKAITGINEKAERLAQQEGATKLISNAEQQALKYLKGDAAQSESSIDEQAVASITQKAEKQAQQEEIKNIINTAETKAVKHSNDASQLVKSIDTRMRTMQFADNGGKLADSKGVNIERMLGRYWNRYQQSKEEKMPELMVFVSLSMPGRGLRELGEQVAKAGGVLVIRGMIENSLPKTIEKVHTLHEKGLPVMINPILFRKFQVSSVPSIVLLDKKNAFCLTPESNCTPVADRITGNVTIDHALELFAASGDYSEKAKEYLAKFRGKP